ncbi:MAG: NAD(P)-binding domain-containing protein [Rhizobiaceae bacterium]|nr:NAD(P)-binding domain-containing protein [Rhizobiaceae bacterium]
MTKLALLGAGGKMGARLSRSLSQSPFSVSHVEISETGRAWLKSELGVDAVPQADALADADIVIMAVPDSLISRVLSGFVGDLRPGTCVIVLDAAAPYAGVMPRRDDITYFVTHPCHPPLFIEETTQPALRDFIGGIAMQHIVCALMQGPEADYARCEAVARAMFAPVGRSHRCTVEQMAILEPALSESTTATLCTAIRDATEHAIGMGVPRQAAIDLIYGHIRVELAILFGELPGARFSDGALQAIDEAQPVIFRDGWMDRIFDLGEVKKSVERICAPDA